MLAKRFQCIFFEYRQVFEANMTFQPGERESEIQDGGRQNKDVCISPHELSSKQNSYGFTYVCVDGKVSVSTRRLNSAIYKFAVRRITCIMWRIHSRWKSQNKIIKSFNSVLSIKICITRCTNRRQSSWVFYFCLRDLAFMSMSWDLCISRRMVAPLPLCFYSCPIRRNNIRRIVRTPMNDSLVYKQIIHLLTLSTKISYAQAPQHKLAT